MNITVQRIVSESLAVRLLPVVPLAFLNEVYPDGVPVSPCLISLDGRDCYEFSPNAVPDETVKTMLAQSISSDAYPLHLLMGLLNYGTVMIPIEWTEGAK
ncbi:MAG TPA: hypothetical protein V6D10_05880 [Trichocoleus sp.]|jgi:hypothetical protein